MEATALTLEKDLKTVKQSERHVSVQEFMQAVETLRAEARLNGTAGMSMEEIDQMISECRQEWRNRTDA